MNVVKLGKKGQVSIPKSVLQSLGVQEEQLLILETTDDGAILLRPAATFPIEMYSDERIEEFLAEERMTPDLDERVAARLRELRGE